MERWSETLPPPPPLLLFLSFSPRGNLLLFSSYSSPLYIFTAPLRHLFSVIILVWGIWASAYWKFLLCSCVWPHENVALLHVSLIFISVFAQDTIFAAVWVVKTLITKALSGWKSLEPILFLPKGGLFVLLCVWVCAFAHFLPGWSLRHPVTKCTLPKGQPHHRLEDSGWVGAFSQCENVLLPLSELKMWSNLIA